MNIELGGNHFKRTPQHCNNACYHCEADDETCKAGCEGCSAANDKPLCEAIRTAYGGKCGYWIWVATKTTGVPQSAEQVGFGF